MEEDTCRVSEATSRENRHPGFLLADVMLCFPSLPKAESTQGFLGSGLPGSKTPFFLLSLAQVSWGCLEGFTNGESGENLMGSSSDGKQAIVFHVPWRLPSPTSLVP